MTIRLAFRCFAFALLFGALPPHAAAAKSRDRTIPVFDIEKSCADAKQFSQDFKEDDDYRSCVTDEQQARRDLAKAWSTFSEKERSECIEPGPDPSYVETLTCLQMDKTNGPGSDVGGPVAPGLDNK